MSGRLKAAGLAGFVLIVAALITWQIWSRLHRERPQSAASKPAAFSMGKAYQATPVSTASNLGPIPAADKPSEPPVDLKPAPKPVVSVPKVQPMGFWDSGDTDAAAPAKQPVSQPAAEASKDPDVASPGPGQSEYAQRMQTTDIASTAPTPPRYHNEYTIKKGYKIPCLPDVPISSELPGPVSCTVTQEVRSLDGSTVLLPLYTQINGNIERGLGTGDRRLFLVWTDALTPAPDFLPIPLGVPAADETGQIGLPGDIKTHLWEKLRASIFVTVIETAGRVAVAASQSGSGNNYFGSAQGVGNGLAEQAFGHDLNIPTTLYRGANQPLVVYVNKYVDLFRYYRNVPIKQIVSARRR